ncbi:kinase-like protein [Lactarius akahatsu]|uniref:Cyclin-dependent kinase 8 n=1 Tax=Lactarius akahatsu TaxID=416441 RepID=A0AAD4LD73_9AGAM|nr:kinase-like protein [Lactarius akahatsu]
MVDDWSQVIPHDVMRIYRAKRDEAHRSVTSKYTILGFISSGTYGRVYKAQSKDEEGKLHAIKKFKPDKDGDIATYTGISQSAIREIALNREISHKNIVALKEVILEDKSIYMVFEYAEHDFLQVIHHYSQTLRSHIPHDLLKSLIYQLLNGLLYLHDSHILHRDLKPANILITATGIVKIGDLGLARLTYQPLQPLFAGDKVVVTIWYRSPELLMGSKHYHKAVDCWAVGCVMAELASLRPIFKGEEAKLDSKKNVPFQKDQLLKVIDVLGKPDERSWPGMRNTPEYHNVKRLEDSPNRLDAWCKQPVNFLSKLFIFDPDKRMNAREALLHGWFQEDPKPTYNVFQQQLSSPAQLPPQRRITQDEAPSMMPAQATHAQHLPAQFTQQQHLQGQTHGSVTSFASMSAGHGGHSRKKARIG